MPRHPATGMRYNMALKTAIRHGMEGSFNIVESMANQVASYEGQKAGEEFRREVYSKVNEKKR